VHRGGGKGKKGKLCILETSSISLVASLYLGGEDKTHAGRNGRKGKKKKKGKKGNFPVSLTLSLLLAHPCTCSIDFKKRSASASDRQEGEKGEKRGKKEKRPQPLTFHIFNTSPHYLAPGASSEPMRVFGRRKEDPERGSPRREATLKSNFEPKSSKREKKKEKKKNR